jgi:hypothetical protein
VRAIEALGEALACSGRPLAVTSGTALLAPGRVVTERDVPDPTSFNALAPAEATALSFVERGARVSVVRFPLTVHGEGDHGFIPALIAIARDKGGVGVPGRRVQPVERGAPARRGSPVPSGGGGSTRRQPPARGRRRGRPVPRHRRRHRQAPEPPRDRRLPEEAESHFTWMAPFVQLDSPASSALTQSRFGWQPTHPGLIPELDDGHYFTNQLQAPATAARD